VVFSLYLSASAWAADTIGTGSGARNQLVPVQLHERVWYFRGQAGMASRENEGFMSNAGFVVGSEGIAVFDTLATPALGTAMLEAIRSISDKPILYIVTSHYHADHFYGLQAFAGSGAQKLAHSAGRNYLNSEEALQRLEQRRVALSPWVDENTTLVSADRWLDFQSSNSYSLSLGDLTLQIMDVSGSHSDSDIMLYVVEAGVLFAGDLFATGRLPFVAGADTARWLEVIDLLKATDASIVVPGHGEASMDVAADLALTENYLGYLRSSMQVAVEELQSFDEAYSTTDWSEFESLPAFSAANRRNAYSVFLELEQASFD
jgi:glyoxylase-like metal-dependent hydrolase (beta-lactamase superfamily II)